MTADTNNSWRISEFDHPDHGWKWTASEVRWIEERIAAVAEEIARKHEKLADDVERCYRMLLSEPNTKGALFKAENILREALREAKAKTPNDEAHRKDAAGGLSGGADCSAAT